jgi:hypothetical protein
VYVVSKHVLCTCVHVVCACCKEVKHYRVSWLNVGIPTTENIVDSCRIFIPVFQFMYALLTLVNKHMTVHTIEIVQAMQFNICMFKLVESSSS